MKHVSDEELLGACSVDRRMWNQVCDDSFLRRRLSKYPGIEKYKLENETWKQFFLRSIYYVSKMQEVYEFQYTYGDFKKQYELLKGYRGINTLLMRAAKEGELPLVKFALEKGADIHVMDDIPLAQASYKGHLEVVKYLVKQGANIHATGDSPVRWAASSGHLDVVKYLVEQGADIHAWDDDSLKSAIKNRHTDVVNYLQSLY